MSKIIIILFILLIISICISMTRQRSPILQENLELCHGPYRAKRTCLNNLNCRWSGCKRDPSLDPRISSNCSSLRMDDCINDDKCVWDGCRDKIMYV